MSASRPSDFCIWSTSAANLGSPTICAPRSGQIDRVSVFDATRPGAEHDDAIGQEHRFCNVMGHEKDGLAALCPDAQQLQVHLLPSQRIESAERLVHQKQPRIQQQCAGKRRTLRHPTGQLHGITLLETG